MIAVTGATGHLGRLVFAGLLEKVPAKELVAIVRTPSKAADLAAKGVHVREGDYERPAGLEAALAGVDKLLLVSSSEVGKRAPQHLAVIAAAKKAGVKLVVYTSILKGDASPLALAAEHVATEKALKSSGLSWVLLRNGWYYENYTERLGPALEHGFVGSAGQGRIAAASRADYAAAAVAVLTGTGHEGKTYELAGTPFTMAELAAEVSKQSGKQLAYVDMPAEAFRKVLLGAGLPPPVADIFVDADVQIVKGGLDDASGQLAKLIGRAPSSLATAVAKGLRA
jgi:NAD(P)H dehydrogenase (quinone)